MSKKLPAKGTVGSLFSGHHAETGWVAPHEFPDLSQYPIEAKFGYDTEYRSHSKKSLDAEIAGQSLCTPDGKRYYLPSGHRGGGNLDENACKRWARKELAGRHLAILNAKGDTHALYNWGVDLEAMGVHLHDPAFKAALLDENRRKFNLGILAKELLNDEKLGVEDTDKSNIADMAASEVGPYAEYDAYLHLAVDEIQQKRINEEELTAVCDLEDQLIYSTVEMERNGALIDRSKLERWTKEVTETHSNMILAIHRETGLRVNPNSQDDLRKLFDSLNLEYPRREEELGGDVTFEEEYLSRVDHPFVRMCTDAKKLDSLNSKYFKKYLKALDSKNILRYDLHQLRGDEYGTVTGRYASANVNINQVMKVESQLEEDAINKWIVRELFIPEPGSTYISADASQIEFRWFAHYSKSVRLIKDYNDDPYIDFHQMVANMLGQKRKDAKHNNFGKLYTMGIPKLARKLGLSCQCSCPISEQWRRQSHASSCRIHKAFDIAAEYDAKFPEALALSKQAMDIAKKRGYVKTRMGRRRRYPTGDRLHSALNAIIQGTAADTLKVKVLECWKARKSLGLKMRMPNHDEIDGDIDSPSRKAQIKELLEAPDSRIACRVPLIWDVEIGDNWRVCTE